jgi:hypothetical protein
MPQFKERAAWESKIQAALMKVNSRFRDELRAALDRAAPEGEIGRILAAMERETQAALVGVFLLLFVSASDGLQLQVAGATGISVAPEAVREDAQRWSFERATSFARTLVNNTADAIRATLTDIRHSIATTATDARELVEKTLDRMLGSSRAEAAAVTETTRAATASEQSLVQRYAEKQVRIRLVWRAEDAPCPVCGEANGQYIDQLPPPLNEGPPAHPHCRCHPHAEIVAA